MLTWYLTEVLPMLKTVSSHGIAYVAHYGVTVWNKPELKLCVINYIGYSSYKFF